MQLELVKEKGIAHIAGYDADYISNLLKAKHWDDIFIPQCKNGETWGARDLLKLDAWCLQRTYSPLTTIGYEIKVSRQDFEQDQKWVKYLDVCHIFFFVCPAGLIRSTDLPSGVGLIWVSQTGKLHTKLKAERHVPDTEKLNHLLIYAMMSRCTVDVLLNPKDTLTDTQAYLKECDEKQQLAHYVKGHVRKIYTETLAKCREFESREAHLKRFEEHLKRLGITWDSTNLQWMDNQNVDNQIDVLKKSVDNWTLQSMRQLAGKLNDTAERIENLQKAGNTLETLKEGVWTKKSN